MTPARIAEIAESAWLHPQSQPLDVAIERAIRLAVNSFPVADKGARAIVVLSDGEDMGSQPVEAARRAFEESGVRVFTVGIGDARDGARIPIEGRNGERDFVKKDGQQVWSKMSPDTLREMEEDVQSSISYAGGKKLMDIRKVNYVILGGDNAGEHLLM